MIKITEEKLLHFDTFIKQFIKPNKKAFLAFVKIDELVKSDDKNEKTVNLCTSKSSQKSANK